MLRFDLNVLWTVINILITYFIVKKFLFKPIHKIIAARQTDIEKQYEVAQTAEDKANELKNQYEVSLLGIEEEKVETINELRKKASTEYERMVTDAKTEADRIVAEAQKQADKEQEKRMMETQGQIADLVIAATAKMVASKTSTEEDMALYNQFLAKTGEQRD